MGELTRVTHVVRSGAADMSHVTDLAIVEGRLYASTRHDGMLDSWTIGGGGLVFRDGEAHAGTLRPGETGWITPLDLGAGTHLLTGGGAADGLVLRAPSANGTLPAGTAVAGTTNVYGTLHHTTVIDPGNGTHVVYGGMAGQGGLAQITFDDTGAVLGRRTVADLGRTHAADIAGTATATVDGKTWLYTASATEHGITSWSVASNGNLMAAHDIGNPEGLWVSTPTALASVQTGGQTFLVLASAGTDSLTVLRTLADGSLDIVDHLLDTRETRFGGVAALEVVTHNGGTYVIAGGADDGITVLQMLPDGQLVTRATLADTTGMSLDNVSAIAATGSGARLDIFVASSSEHGITRLRYDTGPAGATLVAAAAGQVLTGAAGADLLIGGVGDDRLNGGQGDDIIRDGGGTDVMAGGAGADIFVLAPDDRRDTILDFEVGVDRIDLSAWPMLRSRDQLTLAMTATGFTITYGDEVLVVQSSTGTTIDHRRLATEDLMGGARIPQVILPGFAGPVWAPPALPQRPGTGAAGGGGGNAAPALANTLQIGGITFLRPRMQPVNGVTVLGSMARDRLAGTDRNDKIFGRAGDDRIEGRGGTDQIFGGGGRDTLIGHAGDDRIDGEDGDDVLIGGTGDDSLTGGAGADRLQGGAGRDRMTGDGDNDLMQGEDDNDVLDGGAGRDTLLGGTGDDLLVGGDDHDRLDGGIGEDRLYGGAGGDIAVGFHGNDMISGGPGADRLFGGWGQDVLMGGSGSDWLDGGADNDTLTGDDDADTLFGGAGRDRLDGGAGDDRIEGGDDRDVLTGGNGRDRLAGGADHDVLFGGAGGDVLDGGTGNDALDGGWGDDLLLGGNDQDTLIGFYGRDTLYGGWGNDRLDGGWDGDTLSGGAGSDVLIGGAGQDLMFGGAGGDTLTGGSDGDWLYGGDGSDTLDGKRGNDILSGGGRGPMSSSSPRVLTGSSISTPPRTA